jgi:hypothetical protein
VDWVGGLETPFIGRVFLLSVPGSDLALTYRLIVTNAGAEKIAAKMLENSHVLLNAVRIGDGNGNPYQPTPDQTDLRRVVWSGDIASFEKDTEANTVKLLTVLGADAGNFTVREIGFFDGENTLIAVGNIPATTKVASLSGMDNKLKILCTLLVTDANALEINVTPSLNTVDHDEMAQAIGAARTEIENSVSSEFNDKLDGHNNDTTAHGGHFTNVGNPHGTTLQQAAAAQGGADITLSCNMYKGSVTEQNRFAMVSDIKQPWVFPAPIKSQTNLTGVLGTLCVLPGGMAFGSVRIDLHESNTVGSLVLDNTGYVWDFIQVTACSTDENDKFPQSVSTIANAGTGTYTPKIEVKMGNSLGIGTKDNKCNAVIIGHLKGY